MRRPLFILAATVASIPLLTGAAFAATPTVANANAVTSPATAAQQSATLTIAAITKAMNAGKGLTLLNLMCAEDRKAVLLIDEAADFTDALYERSREIKVAFKPRTANGVSPMPLIVSVFDKATGEGGVTGSTEFTLLRENSKWCLKAYGVMAKERADDRRNSENYAVAAAQQKFMSEHHLSVGVPLTVDATKKATTVYLGSTDTSFTVSKGTKMSIIVFPFTPHTFGGFCITTINIGATHPTATSVYDSRIGGTTQPDGLTC